MHIVTLCRPLEDLAPLSSRTERPARRRRIVREIVLLAVLFGIYSLGRFITGKHAGAAFLNADALIHFQTSLGLPSEAQVQSLALRIPDLDQFANRYYAGLHFPLTAIVLLWMLIKRPAEYAKARWSLAALTGLGLVGHLVFPLAPPRMLPQYGWIDTGVLLGQSVYGPDAESGPANQFAAMPSLHVGWAFMVAVFLIRATRSRWRWLWIAHPVITFAVVVVTANHYWLDGLIALALAVPLVLIFDSRRVRRNNASAGGGQRSAADAVATVIGIGSPRSAGLAAAPPRRREHRRAALLPSCEPGHRQFLSAIGALSRSTHREQANRQEQQMKHRIVILGAGYAGAYVAGNLARRLSSADTEITVVNAEPDFVERLRLHQFAAGRKIDGQKLADVFAGTGVRLRLARVTAVDPERQVVAVADADGGGELGYDTLLYTLGSAVADHGVPGVAEHAFHVTSRPAALRLRERLDNLGRRGEGGKVLVVGDGLTGIETATEFAESRPGLSVSLVARGELGARLSPGARRHLRQACDRLGVTVLEHTSVEAVEATRVLCADGTALASDATVWTAGFAVNPIAAAGGLEVTENGQIVVDRTMRSVSHPNVYAAGDSVFTLGENGRPLPMSCASAGYTGRQATEAIVGRLTGSKIANIKLDYPGNHISLGRRDGILQPVDDEAQAKPKYVGGRKAARIKVGILKISLWAVSHPTFGVPKRRRRLAAAQAAFAGDGRAAA